ncbi:MAG: hypothetical protein ACC608_05035 [Anaerofustis sp.]
MQKYNKTYSEHYARLTLIESYDAAMSDLTVADKPDLQSETLGCGIEVTQALSENEGRCNFDLINRFRERGYGYEDIRKEVLRRSSQSVGYPYESGEKQKMFDPATTFNLVQDRIADKLEKLNSNYRIFHQNGLYIFAETPLLKEFDIRLITTFIEVTENEYPVVFDLYFINCIDILYVYRTHQRTLMPITISTHKLKGFREEALRLSAEDIQS